MAMRADTRYRFKIDNELAFRIAIAGMEGLAKTRTTLYQLSTLALGTGNCCFIWLINLFCMLTFRIATATNKHTKTALA
ncbi:hypothetical protein ABR32_00645 [Enterobacter cloacae subsp. dissolvens]|nr:hypothetical protein ABR32_00645 [Enterobacter cloacae subsp. dissolvens]